MPEQKTRRISVVALREKAAQRGIEKMALTPEELAGALGVSLSTAYNLIRTGRIRFTRVGKRILVPISAVEEFLNGKEVARAGR